MCYRKDLFAKAGLPTERDAVSKLWPTWQDYIATGEKFNAAKTGASFLDAATNTFNTILLQTAGNTQRLQLLRHQRQPGRRQQPGRAAGLGHHHGHHRLGPLRQVRLLVRGVGVRLQAGRSSPPSPARPG